MKSESVREQHWNRSKVTGFLPVEKRAILHVHTKASDGTGSVEQVVGEAQLAGVDILGINDHNTLKARDMELGGWHSSLFLLAGTELEDPCENSHILAYGIDELPSSDISAQQIAYVNQMGGIAIAAHPTEAPGRLPRTRSYSWTAPDTEGLAGVEVWNYMSLWKKDISLFNAPSKLRYPDRCVEHPDSMAIEFWKGVGGCAVAGPDAHALRFGIGRMKLEVFPYRMLFRRLLTHILFTEDLPVDCLQAEGAILDALKRGSCFTSNALWGDARGFRAIRDGHQLRLRLPGAGDVTVTGDHGYSWKGWLEAGEHSIEKLTEGPMSVDVSREGATWIFCGIQ